MLAASDIRGVGNEKDKDDSSYVWKAVIGSGMALNINGLWEVWKLFPHLQAVLKKYLENFQGTPVSRSLNLDGEVTESE